VKLVITHSASVRENLPPTYTEVSFEYVIIKFIKITFNYTYASHISMYMDGVFFSLNMINS
jgi:hypothetical protein